MAQRGNGGIIGPANVPTNQVATGVWNLEEQQIAKSLGAWPSDYRISRSLRFNSADSAYLTRTFATGGTSRTTCTFSAWVKRGALGTQQRIIDSYNGTGASTKIELNTSNQILVGFGNVSAAEIVTTAVYRDPSAWYHILVAFDSTQATSTNRIKLFVNGVQVTAFSSATYPAQNEQYSWMYAGSQNRLGSEWSGALTFLNGYMTEVNFIDGQALTPSSFGQTNANTGVWEPKPYAGTYGTNGFYLNFSDNSNTTATTLGKDYSGNGNNWTPNNFSVAAGPGNDSMVDVPTPWGVDTGLGGQVRGSYCTLNPISIRRNFALSNGNLAAVNSGNNDGVSTGTIALPATGKWYWEARQGPLNGGVYLMYTGLLSKENFPNDTFVNAPGAIVYPRNTAVCFYNNSGTANCISENCVEGDVYGVAYDADAATVNFYKNGVLYSGQTVYVTPGVTYYPFLSIGNQGPTATINFGQQPFIYPAPSGYKTLCTQNLPTPTVGATASTQAGKFFNAVTYAGTGTTQNITGVGFQPDFTWLKSRSNVQGNVLTDVVRGVGKMLTSETANSEITNSAYGYLSAFGSDGFTLTPGTTGADLTNFNGWTYVAWNWKANGAGVTNTAGSITSTVSANTTSGFSVVTYTGTGSAATVGHGLGSAPRMIIVKSRNFARNWNVYHGSLGATQGINLNATAAATTDSGWWNNTAPTSAVFTAGSYSSEGTVTYVAYCFAEVPGFSKFGSYTGNGSADGPFVYCGFRPAYVMVKLSSSGGSADWIVEDGTRNPYNVVNAKLSPNTSGAEFVDASAIGIDFLSNGFKIRGTDGAVNTANTYIFAAFASTPQKFALAR